MRNRTWLRRLAVLLVALLCLPGLCVQADSGTTLVTQRQIYIYLTTQLGLNSAAACGILANMEAESGFSTTAVGDGGTSFGLCQWHDSRYAGLVSFCQARGQDYRSLTGQLEYLRYELRTNYSGLMAQLLQVEDTGEGANRAAYLWCVQFERPANMEEKGEARGNAAQYKYFLRYHNAVLPGGRSSSSFAEQMTEQMSPLPTAPASEWTMPAASGEETQPEQTGEKPASRPARFRAYVPHHLPKQQEPASPLGVAVGLLFAPLSDGRRRRKIRLPVPEPVPR